MVFRGCTAQGKRSHFVSISPGFKYHRSRGSITVCSTGPAWSGVLLHKSNQNWALLTLVKKIHSAILALLNPQMLIVPPWQCCWEQPELLFSQLKSGGLHRMFISTAGNLSPNSLVLISRWPVSETLYFNWSLFCLSLTTAGHACIRKQNTETMSHQREWPY